MTKKELIEQLALMPDDAVIYATDYETGCSVPLKHVLAYDDPGHNVTKIYVSFDRDTFRY